MLFIDVSSSCKSAKNTGMQRMTRGLYRHLAERVPVRPICWNRMGKRYQDLGPRELQVLQNPFQVMSRATARPEWYGETRTAEWMRLFFRKTLDLERELTSADVLLIPDFYRDARSELIPRVIGKTGVCSVAIFHDAAALRWAGLSEIDRQRFHQYLQSLAACDVVICISQESQDDLLRIWREAGISPPPTVVEPWPVEFDDLERDDSTNAGQPIVACIASFEPRKNHLTLLAASEKLWSRGLNFELQLVGRTTHYSARRVIPAVWRLRSRGRAVHWLRHISDDDLHQVLRSCRFTVYPSFMEGFGLPIAESLWHGKPVVCGGNGALGEIARAGGCLIVDQRNEESLAAGIEKLLTDEQEYSRLREEARTRTFRTWTEYIEKFLGYLAADAQPRARHEQSLR